MQVMSPPRIELKCHARASIPDKIGPGEILSPLMISQDSATEHSST